MKIFILIIRILIPEMKILILLTGILIPKMKILIPEMKNSYPGFNKLREKTTFLCL